MQNFSIDNAIMYLINLVLLIFGLIALGIVLFFLGKLLIIWYKNRGRERTSLESVLLQIALPRDNEIKIDTAEQLFSSLSAVGRGGLFKLPPHLSFEIVGMPGDIRFYVHTPKKLQDLVEKQINGAYPDAEIKIVSVDSVKREGMIIGNEYNIFSREGKVAFTSLKLKSANYMPIKVYKDLPTDPLSSITSVLAKMTEGEGAAIQILITPSDSNWKKQGRSYLTKTKKIESNPETAKYSSDAKELEGIENKISKPGFKTTIRIVVSSTSKESAEAHLGNIMSIFSQFEAINAFKKNKHRFKSMFMDDFIYRYLPMMGESSVLTSEELATLYHFPNKSVTTPNIFWMNAKRAPAPATIPTSGLYLGKSTYRGLAKPVYMDIDDRRRHMYIIGKTGTGKSEFLKDMIMQDIRSGQGLAVIDPHGDLIDDILPQIPPKRAEDVILFDPSDTSRPMGVNMLEAQTEEQKHYVVSSIIGLMYKLFDPNKTGIIGPRFEHAVRNAMLTVMYEKGSTFVEVVRVLTDANYVQELLPKVTDPIIRRYWTDQIAQTSDFHKSEVLDYIVSKFGRFVTNKMIRNIIGQSDSAFDFRKVMDEKKVLLINLAKGKIGEENSQFLGLILVPRILSAAMSRQDMAKDKRCDFFLYVDEFQNFATPDFAQILSEARKYKLNLIVANQFIGQMDEEVKNAIFGNVGSLISFRVGVNDANYLQHEFQPVFTEADLINVERYNTYVKTIVGGEPVTPFSMDLTRDLSREKSLANPRVAELVKELSRLKYGKDAAAVEVIIAQRARL
ncbi:MAG: type IV secretion system DNA-binding domain-containing protein [Candidatus Levybacteria bacterium]|nr:type IV secretion system DNA-binding domain-containing protein [Candidatus Levybacteria bacterium]MDZ4227681.1 type IV secretion system DNA-binding domain-containing protein [Candidatus Levybacteria bacterium]